MTKSKTRTTLLKDYRKYFSILLGQIGNRFILFIILTLLVAFSETLGITMILPLLSISDVGGEATGRFGQAVFDILEFLHVPIELKSVLLFIGLLFAIKFVLKLGEGIYKAYLSSDLYKTLKNKIFYYYAHMRYKYYASKNTGHFINVINPQVNHFFIGFQILAQFTSNLVTTLVYLSIAFLLNWKFSVAAIIAGILTFSILKYVNRYSKKYSIKSSYENSNLNGFLVQTLHSMKYLKATARFDQLKNDIERSVGKLSNFQFRLISAQSLVTALKEPFIIIFIILIIIIQTQYLQEPISAIMVTLLLFYRGMNKLSAVQIGWQQFMMNVGGIELVTEELEVITKHQEEFGGQKIETFNEKIEFKNLSFSYQDRPTLIDLNFSIPKNKTIAFVGESGAGKSTLFDIITMVQSQQEGEMYIDGVASSEIDKRSWRQKIGYVTQETVLFDDTIANNISLWTKSGSEEETRAKIEDMAKKAYIHKHILETEDGYDSLIGDRGVRLSGGQRQRLSIARELYKEPQVLLLDEATSALDSESEQYIQSSIDALKGKMTVLIIAHRLSTIKNADYIYVLDKGEVVESGSFDELIKTGPRFQRMVEKQEI